MNVKIMKSKRIAAVSVATLSIAAATSIFGQSSQLGPVAPIKQVYGHEVVSSDNQKVGNLNNLVVDLESGRILYGVVAASKGRVGVPPGVFASTLPSNKEMRVNVDKAKLEGAPQFNSSVDTPNGIGQASFVSQVYQHFGQGAWWQGNTPANEGSFHNVHKASQVVGMKVEDVNNHTLGKIDDVVVNLPAGRIAYIVMSPDSSLNLGNNLYVLPPQAFTLSADTRNLVSNIDPQKLAGSPHFAKGQTPNYADPGFASQVYQYYGKDAWFQGNSGSVQPTGR